MIEVHRIYDVDRGRVVTLRGGFVFVRATRSIWDRLAEEIQLAYDKEFVRDIT